MRYFAFEGIAPLLEAMGIRRTSTGPAGDCEPAQYDTFNVILRGASPEESPARSAGRPWLWRCFAFEGAARLLGKTGNTVILAAQAGHPEPAQHNTQ